MIRKSFTVLPGTTKVLDADKGIVEGWVNSTGVVDAQKDVMEPGCWADVTKAATEGRVSHPSTVWGHDWNITTGKVVSATEYPPGSPEIPAEIRELGAGSIKIVAAYNLDTQRGREAFSDVKFGAIRQWSVGFIADPDSIRYDSKGVRHIGRVQDWPEVSNVLMGASPGTMTASVKSLSPGERKERRADRLARAFALIEGYKANHPVARAVKAKFEMDDGKYPIDTCADVEDAWGLRNHSTTHTSAQVVRHIRHAASELGCDGPWNDGSHDENGEETGKGVGEPEQKASHSHYHVHTDGTAHTHGHGHGPDVAEHDGPAEKVPHAHGHAVAEEPADGDEHKAMCCDDCKGQDCPGCCADCCHGSGTAPATTAGKGGGLPGDPPGVPYLEGDEAQHNGPLMQVLDGINTLIAQEIGEGGYTEYGDIIRLCCLAQDAISWAAGEQTEYGDYAISIWDLFAAGRAALSSKTETTTDGAPAEKAVAPMPAWLKAAIATMTETGLEPIHNPVPAHGEGDGLERRFTDGFAGFRGLHLWLQQGALEPGQRVTAPAEAAQDDETGPPAEWAERFTSPWRQQQ
jgi:hypothetical protein